MEELSFFYNQLDEKKAIKEVESFKARISKIDYEIKNFQGINLRNLIYCSDYLAYSFEAYDLGGPESNVAIGWTREFHSSIENIRNNYNLWIKKSFPQILSRGDLIKDSLIEYYKNLDHLPTVLQSLFKELIKDFTLRLLKYYPNLFDKSSFLYLDKSNIAPMLPKEALDTLIKIYRFKYNGQTVTSSISQNEWVEFFVSGVIPTTKIELNFNTKASSDILEYLSNVYNLNKRQFYRNIEDSGIMITKSGSILTYRNIAKSNSDFTPNAIKFRDALKKYLL